MSAGSEAANPLSFLGIGIGPFNLSLAALAEPHQRAHPHVMLERRDEYAWHSGMLLPGTTLQVPFLADLVSMVDPTNRFSFLNYLAERRRLYHFYFLESMFIPRKEYDHYGRWAAGQLDSCRFDHDVQDIDFDRVERTFRVKSSKGTFWTRSIVVGTGTEPSVPSCFRGVLGERVFHTSHFAGKSQGLRDVKHVVVAGSGQSAAECVLHLLQQPNPGRHISWVTRSAGFLPMEYSKLGLAQYFTPSYRDYFFGLGAEQKDRLLKSQDHLFKGISAATISALYDAMYESSIGGDRLPVSLCPMQDVMACVQTEHGFHLTLRQTQTELISAMDADAVVLGTGYKPSSLAFLDNLSITRDSAGRPEVSKDFRLRWPEAASANIYVQNAEIHTHGVGAPDLGLGADRSARILNGIMGANTYRVIDETIFHTWKPSLETGISR